MRKLVTTTVAVLMLPLLSANSCSDHNPRSCKPGTIRKDHAQEPNWWVCNKDGTAEDRITGPGMPNPGNS
jgi:hypothetical protein